MNGLTVHGPTVNGTTADHLAKIFDNRRRDFSKVIELVNRQFFQFPPQLLALKISIAGPTQRLTIND